MKKVVSETWLFGIVLTFGLLTACGQSAPTWQEQYDLGVRYLSEGSYEEAVIAFTAAIEIDPKQASAYVGRGDAYIGSGETEENLSAAQADYEMAIELDEMLAEVYLKLAEVLQKQGDEESAKQILQQGYDITNNEELQRRINKSTKLKSKEGYPKTERYDNEDGSYLIEEYDEFGQLIRYTPYNSDGSLRYDIIHKYDEFGNCVYTWSYTAETYIDFADPSWTTEIYFDQSGRVIERNTLMAVKEDNTKYDYTNSPTVIISDHTIDTGFTFTDQDLHATTFYKMQDEENTLIFGGYGTAPDESHIYYYIEENNTDGDRIRSTEYWLDGSLKEYTTYEETAEGTLTNTYGSGGELIRSAVY